MICQDVSPPRQHSLTNTLLGTLIQLLVNSNIQSAIHMKAFIMYSGSIKKVRKGEVIFDVVWLMVPDIPDISETADLLGSSHTTISRFTENGPKIFTESGSYLGEIVLLMPQIRVEWPKCL